MRPELEHEIAEIVLADELRAEMECTSHSLLRVVAERLIEEKEQWSNETRHQIVDQEPDFERCIQLTKALDQSVTPYQSLLTELVRTEKAIGTGLDYISIMELEDDEFDRSLREKHPGTGGDNSIRLLRLYASLSGDETLKRAVEDINTPTFEQVIRGTKPEELAVGKAESALAALRNGNLLMDDPSGFLLVTQFSEEHNDSPVPFSRQGQPAREQAAKDYKAMYLVGTRAGLGPLPKE